MWPKLQAFLISLLQYFGFWRVSNLNLGSLLKRRCSLNLFKLKLIGRLFYIKFLQVILNAS